MSRWHEAWWRGGRKDLKGARRAGRRPLVDSAELAKVEKTLRRGPLDPNLFRAMNALTKVNQSGISPTLALPYAISYGSWDGAKC